MCCSVLKGEAREERSDVTLIYFFFEIIVCARDITNPVINTTGELTALNYGLIVRD